MRQQTWQSSTLAECTLNCMYRKLHLAFQTPLGLLKLLHLEVGLSQLGLHGWDLRDVCLLLSHHLLDLILVFLDTSLQVRFLTGEICDTGVKLCAQAWVGVRQKGIGTGTRTPIFSFCTSPPSYSVLQKGYNVIMSVHMHCIQKSNCTLSHWICSSVISGAHPLVDDY